MRAEAPELLTVHRLEPESAAAGDRLMVTGDGFPSARAATVMFEGDLFRPGASTQRDVRISIAATPAGRNAVSATLTPEVERRFAGSGERSAHTTFRGRVRVTFEPGKSGLTTVAGVSRDVTFDVLPAARPDDEHRFAEGRSTLAFLGITAGAEPGTAGLAVTEVDPDGRAAAAGLAPGDRLVALNDVTVISESDLRVPSGARRASLVVEREGRRLPALDVDVNGAAPRRADDLGYAATLLLLACAALVAPGTRFGFAVRWLGRRPEGKRPSLGVAADRRSSGPSTSFAALLAPAPGGGPAVWVAAALVLSALLFAVAWLSLGRALIGPDLDVAVLALGAACSLLLARFADGGRDRGPWSLLDALASTARTAACIAPAFAAIAGAVLSSGRFVIAEMIAEQGGAPYRWAGFRNPGLFVLGMLLVLSAVAETDHRPALPPSEGLGGATAPRSPLTRALVRLAEWTYLWTMASISVLLFWGGSRVPGLSALAQEARPAYVFLGVVLVFAKLAAVVFAVGVLRRLAGRVAVEQAAALAGRHLLPASVAATCLAVLWATALDGADLDAAAHYAGVAALAVALALVLVAAAVHRLRRTPATSTVNPWL